MPVLFISHGAPNIILDDDPILATWKNLAQGIPDPQSILLISAHWETNDFIIGGNQHQKTIHDFHGFPDDLYDHQYPALPAVKWADKLAKKLGIRTDHSRGLDHAAWIPLLMMYPFADIPVMQMSVSPQMGFHAHFSMGEKLVDLRERRVLIVGSGSLVHNLRLLNWQSKQEKPDSWSHAFMNSFETALSEGDSTALCNPGSFHNGELAVPTAEHYLPFLVAYAAGQGGEIKSHCRTWRYGSLGMQCYWFS